MKKYKISGAILLMFYTAIGCKQTTSSQEQTMSIVDSVHHITTVTCELIGLSEQVLSLYKDYNSMNGMSKSSRDTVMNQISFNQTVDTTTLHDTVRNDSLILSWRAIIPQSINYAWVDTFFILVLDLDRATNSIRSVGISMGSDYSRGSPHGGIGGDSGFGADTLQFTAMPHTWNSGSLTIELGGASVAQYLSSVRHSASIDGGNHFDSYTRDESLLSPNNFSATSARFRLVLR
jgi:hypothetical protein